MRDEKLFFKSISFVIVGLYALVDNSLGFGAAFSIIGAFGVWASL